jgi:outer membrane protein assembly factor BamB
MNALDSTMAPRWHFTSSLSDLRCALGITALSLSLAGGLQGAGSAHWPAWRGPDSNGSTAAGKHPVKTGTNAFAWKVALPGKGGSSPIVWDGRIFLTTPAEGMDAVLCLDTSGQQQWLTKVGPESSPKHRTLGSSCNSSPVTDGKGIFAYFRSGHLVALERDGSIRWKINLSEKFGTEQLFWDQGSSPVLNGSHVILSRLHQGESWIAAFHKDTGVMEWKEPRNFKVPNENDNGYTTPVVFDHSGSKALLVWGADHLTAHSAADGKLLWSAGGFNPDATPYWPAISTPVIANGIAVVPVGRDDRPRQAQLQGIKLGGSGDVSATHRAWKRDDLGVFVTALAEYGGRVYLLRHRGEIVCLNPATGQTVWSEALPKDRAPFYASPLIANGVLYAAREDGVLFSAKVGDKFEFLGETPLGERVVSSPVPAGDTLLVRGDKHLFCLR